MTRDMDLIRAILISMEKQENSSNQKWSSSFDGFTDEEVGFHCHLLDQAGLIKAADATSMGNSHPYAIPLSITWAGYDFLSAARDDTLWKKAKATVMKPAMSWTFDLVKEWLKGEIAQGFPTAKSLGT